MRRSTGVKRQRVDTSDASSNDEQRAPTAAVREVIRERAYGKWEEAGCPGSDGVEFWLQAEAELAAETPPSKHKS